MLTVSTQIAREDDLTIFARMLDSVRFADELIIFNMERSDSAARTLFKKYRAKVVEVRTPKVVEEIRARQVREAAGDWVLVMDYDEIVTPALAKEIRYTIHDKRYTNVAYYLSRRNYSLGYPLRHGGFGNDLVARLFHKLDFVDWPHDIHALPSVKGTFGTLSSHMEHHKDASLEQMVEKTNRYSDVEATQFFVGGLTLVTPLTLTRKKCMETFRRGILKGGLLDGPIGLIQSLYQGYSVFISYAKLYEKQLHASKTDNNS